MAEVRIDKLRKQFPDGTIAVHEFNLTIPDGELFVMLGPSGCGKTTTLRCVAGLEHQTDGDIYIGDDLVNDKRPSERDIAMVFQFYALYPHLNTRDNIAFPLKAAGGRSSTDIEAAVDRAAKTMQIEDLLDAKPTQLSGGEQQRVALARATVREPQVFLMDEPLTNLDAELRVEMRTELRHLQQRLGSTMIHVTHDQIEAMSLGDRIGIMSQGRLEQVGSPIEVYRHPATLFVAAFIGSPPMNIFDVAVEDGGLVGLGLRMPATEGLDRTANLKVGVRPENLELVGDQPTPDSVPAEILSREALGDETIFAIEVAGEQLSVRTAPTAPWLENDKVHVRYSGGPPPVYDSDTGRTVNAPESREAVMA